MGHQGLFSVRQQVRSGENPCLEAIPENDREGSILGERRGANVMSQMTIPARRRKGEASVSLCTRPQN